MGYYCFVEKMGLLNVWCGVVTRIMILELRGIWWGKAEGRVESLGKILLIKGRKRKGGEKKCKDPKSFSSPAQDWQ